MKKQACIIVAAALTAALGAGVLTGCSCSVNVNSDSSDDAKDDTTEVTTGMANPMVESNRAGVLDETGIELDAPEGATDTTYYYIDVDEGEDIAEIDFTLNGNKVCYRAAEAEGTTLTDISGLYESWTNETDVAINGRTGTLRQCSGIGNVIWIDVAPGLVYSYTVEADLSEDELIAQADACFVPAQGDD